MTALDTTPPAIPPACLTPDRRDAPFDEACMPPGLLADRDDLPTRPAMPADTDAIGRMLARSYRALLAPDYDPALLREALPIIGRARPGVVNSGTYFVIEQDERVLAAGGWTDISPHGAPGRAGEAHVRHVAVDPDVVGLGLGRRILQRTLSSARAAGMKALHCQSTITAQPFYQAMGFETRAQIDVRLPTGILFPAVQMHWSAPE